MGSATKITLVSSLIIILLIVVLSLNARNRKTKLMNEEMAPVKISEEESKIALIETDRGEIKIRLAVKEAPKTTANFIKLADKGFYDNLTFHRVDKGFVVQGGDPLGTGMGGADKEINLEIMCKDGRTFEGRIAPRDCVPVLPHHKGAIAMARADNPNSASSQFYITLEKAHFLNRKYAVFGYVIEGQDIVDNIKVGDKMKSIEIEE